MPGSLPGRDSENDNMAISRATKSVAAAAVAVITFIVFLPALRNGFINWDDNFYIYENPFIRAFDAQLLDSAFTGFHAINWHPLTWLSHAVDFALWGLDPVGHHLTNNILHAINSALVMLLIIKLLEVFRRGRQQTASDDRAIMITGIMTGMLFGLHPLHVESVAWVSERKDLLCAFFFLLTVISYSEYATEIGTHSPGSIAPHFFSRKYLVTSGFFILSLLSKPMAVTLPVVLLILDWHPLGRIRSLKTFQSASIEKIPFFVLSFFSSLLTVMAQRSGGAVKSVAEISMESRTIVAVHSLIAYLGKMVWPFDLSPFYPYPEKIDCLSSRYVLSIILVTAVTATCLAVARQRKLWISAWSYYVITLIPVLGIVQVGDQAMADRYTYLPSLSPFFLAGLVVATAYNKASAFPRASAALRAASLTIALAALLCLSYTTFNQIGIWTNSIVFWNYVTLREPSVPFVHNNLGEAYMTAGRFDLAREQLLTALRLKPYYAEAHFNLGLLYLRSGYADLARGEFAAGLAIKPTDIRARQILNSLSSP